MAWWTVAIAALVPSVVLAQSPNPFVPRVVNQQRAAPINVFAPSGSAAEASRSDRSVDLPPPPLPLPPPIPVRPAASLQASEPAVGSEPASRGNPPGHNCVIAQLPSLPDVEAEGAELVIRIPDAAARCIAGVEAQQEWLRIQFFNGRELHLQIDSNPGTRQRTAALVFASMNDSQLIQVRQAARHSEGLTP